MKCTASLPPLALLLIWCGLPGCNGGPPSEQVERTIRGNLQTYAATACGLIGSVDLRINRVEEIHPRKEGSGTAKVNVTNTTMFNAPRTCDLLVTYHFAKHDGKWALSSLDAQPWEGTEPPTGAARSVGKTFDNVSKSLP